ncbi:PemK family transcriptional regulator [Candidatus Woesearchaeota archaeon]|jgi:mRNA interferase MazF|nr:PemK family transcriptional regulator [Candidatus Woesearchaeota archaeon]|tara:strand:+ start:391 stop:744 length:354 start_codon:yes stop_codon:yes gene_type:complete
MSKVRRGEIWIVNLDPTLGHEIKKARPGVIIQNDIGNEYSPITIIAPITSQNVEKIYPFEVSLTKKITGLDKDSKVLLNQIRAIDKKRLVKKLGKVDVETLNKVDYAIRVSLGLNNE